MKILKIWSWLWLLSQFSLISAQTTSEQNFYPEAPLELRNGILFSTQITIGFDNHSVTKNITDAEKIAGNQIKPGAFKSCITTFCTTRNINLEDICLKRGIPAWPAGMVTVTDRNNGDIRPAVDLSLVYMLDFRK
jgi:hypothetical protein